MQNCEAELFKLEPNGDVECLRELLGTTLDTPTVECQLAAIEALNACTPDAECNDEEFAACFLPFEVAVRACPEAALGFETLADGCLDRTGEELVALYNASLDAAFEESCRCVPDEEREACLAFKEAPREDCLTPLRGIDPLPRRVTECLIEYLDEEIEFLEDEACCEGPDDLDCRTGPFWFSGELHQLQRQRFQISGALAFCLGSEQNLVVYTATGTLSDTVGGDAAQLDGATMTVRISANPDALSTPLSSGTSERAVWNAAASACEPTRGCRTRNAEVPKYAWVTCLADNLSDPMVIAATAFGELRHGSGSGTLGSVERAHPRWVRASSSLMTGVSQLRT